MSDEIRHMDLVLVESVPGANREPVTMFSTRDGVTWKQSDSGMFEVHVPTDKPGVVHLYSIPATNIACVRMLNCDLGAMMELAKNIARAQLERAAGAES